MINTPQILDGLWSRGTPCPFSEIIDVRSPGEYAEDHVPGAINLPVLNDVERAEVGTIYQQVGPFPARKLGAALVSANISRHLRDHFTDKGKDYRPLIYCWRGGQRSASLSHILAQIGWRVSVLNGGYKTYRTHVLRELETLPESFAYRIIAGATGTGKTQILHRLAERGEQILDLEALANHRGSVLGRMGPQPSQKLFDSQLLHALNAFAPDKPVWVESESNRIGDVYLPPTLWALLRAADGFRIHVPIAGRVQHLLLEYAHLLADGETLKGKLNAIATRHGPHQIEVWNRQIEACDWHALVASLLTVHYDPAYAKSSGRCYPNISRNIPMRDVSPEAVDELATLLLAAC